MPIYNATSLSVMLLDDHEVIRQGVELLLRQEHGLNVVGSFATSRELFAALRERSADVLIVDYSLGPMDVDGLNLIRALKVRFPGEKVLMMSAHYNAAIIGLAMKVGAHGFIGKGQDHKELIRAIRAVAAGRIYLSEEMARAIAGLPGEASDDTSEAAFIDGAKLSPREREVIRCYLDGMSVSEIAAKFSRSITTISAQKSSAYRKLGIRRDSELFKIHQQLL